MSSMLPQRMQSTRENDDSQLHWSHWSHETARSDNKTFSSQRLDLQKGPAWPVPLAEPAAFELRVAPGQNLDSALA